MRELDRLDEEALQAYLQEARAVTVDAYAAARLLQQGLPRGPEGQLHYPSGASQQVNFKVLLNFHTEYILDQAGHFLNEVDPVEVSENGIVNGASLTTGWLGDGPIRI